MIGSLRPGNRDTSKFEADVIHDHFDFTFQSRKGTLNCKLVNDSFHFFVLEFSCEEKMYPLHSLSSDNPAVASKNKLYSMLV